MIDYAAIVDMLPLPHILPPHQQEDSSTRAVGYSYKAQTLSEEEYLKPEVNRGEKNKDTEEF